VNHGLEYKVRSALLDLAEHGWVVLGDPVIVRRVRDACRGSGYGLRVTWRLPGYFHCELIPATLAEQVEGMGYNLGLQAPDNR
jgi:hypothetical protein